MIFGLLTLILLLGIFLMGKKSRNGSQKQNPPPGPWGLPLFGHLPILGHNPHLTLLKWKKKYGPIVSCRFGSFPTVILCDSKLLKEAYSMSEFAGRPHLPLVLSMGAFRGITFGEGPHHSELRQFTIKKFKEFGAGRKKLEGQIHNGVSEFMDFVNTRKGLPVNSADVPCAHIIKTLWSIMMTNELDSREIEQLHDSINRFVEMGSTVSELASFMPWLEKTAGILSLGRFSFLTAKSTSIDHVISFMAKFLQEKKIKWDKGQSQGQSPSDMMEMFFEKMSQTTDASSAFHESRDSATMYLTDTFSAGMHTVHGNLVWMLNFMAANPEVQSKLHEEIDQVVGIGSGNDLSRLPSLLDQNEMPYADAVVHEILRMSSVVPLSIPHQTLTDVSFHGYTIKKNTMVFANTYGIHHDPEIWGDPENFRPERWFGDSGKRLKSEHFFPFSTGRRMCPGDALAREQLFLYVTTLFQKFTVNFHRGKVPEVKGVFGVTLHPSKFTVVFSERKIQ